jgi:two-component system, NtrC family, response regulator AtoC
MRPLHRQASDLRAFGSLLATHVGESGIDIPNISKPFPSKHLRQRHKSSAGPISPLMLKLFEKHTSPGNIRQLENLMERYVILGSEEAIGEELANWERAVVTPQLPGTGPIHLKNVTRKARAGAGG